MNHELHCIVNRIDIYSLFWRMTGNMASNENTELEVNWKNVLYEGTANNG